MTVTTIHYEPSTGKILSSANGENADEILPDPTIQVQGHPLIQHKRVDTKTASLEWDYTLSEAKEEKTQEIKDQAYQILSKTDWYITREQETGEAIPQDVLDHRSQVRSDSDAFEQEVNDLTKVEEVLNYEYNFPEPPEP